MYRIVGNDILSLYSHSEKYKETTIRDGMIIFLNKYFK